MSDKMPVTLACGGDVSLGRGIADAIRRQGAEWVFDLLAPTVASADLMTFNWESPVLPTGTDPPEKGLVVPEELIAGVTDALPPLAVTMANNHVLDAGVAGIPATRRRLDGLGVAHFGAGETEEEGRALHVVEVKGLRIGFLGRAEDCPQLSGRCAPGPALIRMPQLIGDVRAGAERCDCLVVHLHQGVEFVDWPGPHFVWLCRELIRVGARLVIGNHPHVPQGHERHAAGHIFYSLGDLVFDVANSDYLSQGSPWTSRSVVALLPVGPHEVGEPILLPHRIDTAGRPIPLDGAEATEVLDHVAAISADLADEAAMQRHWRDTALRYLGINIRWAKDGLDENGLPTEEMLRSFFSRLALDENRAWARELFGDAEWVRNIHRPPWT